jgi:cyclopropane-fatty-acyl-phospholipid synthase
VPEKANEQHYEVPAQFFELVLGTNLKYSSGYWSKEVFSLDESEYEMLKITCERAGLVDGQDILELGCGWGSLTCFMAQKFPNSKITAVSNSKDQRNFIQQKNDKLNLQNIKVVNADMNDFSTDEKFDRVISIEMFEHMRNYDELLKRINGWLKQNGKLFVHIFSHKEVAYPFEDKGDGDWMAREFFSGGQMPSHRLLMSFPDRMKIEKDWRVSGTHYEKTSLAWLRKMNTNKIEILELFKTTYGEKDASEWFQRWRIFFMSCEVLFGFNEGSEWGVSHYLFEKP